MTKVSTSRPNTIYHIGRPSRSLIESLYLIKLTDKIESPVLIERDILNIYRQIIGSRIYPSCLFRHIPKEHIYSTDEICCKACDIIKHYKIVPQIKKLV